MKYSLRLNSGTDYSSDIKSIINSIKANGNRAVCRSIIVSHPKGEMIELFMNFALEQNSSNPPMKASLNILGFKNHLSREFIFDNNQISISKDTKEIQKLHIDGSYKSLGFPMELPNITDANLYESLVILNKCKDANQIGALEYHAIARLFIASSEAIRFCSVANGIQSILGTTNTYTPNSFEIIGWGGHSIAS